MTPGSLLLKISLLLALVAVAQMLCARRVSAATRHLVWVLALAAVLLLPLLSALLPGWTVVRIASPRPAPMAIDVDVETPRVAHALVGPVSSASVAVTMETTPRTIVPSWPLVVSLIYAAGVVLLLVRWTAERISIERVARRATPAGDAQWRRLIDECAARMGVAHTIPVLRSRELTVPLAFGFRRGTILLPCIADSWSEDRMRAVLLHELGHVARFDCLTQMAATLACALYWIHPGVWWVSRQLRMEQELACDDLVLATGTNPRDYAGHLLQLAYALRSHAPSVAVGMAGSRRLEDRLVALLDTARNRATPSVAKRVAGGLTMAAVIVPIAAATTGVAQPPASPAAGAAQAAVAASQDQVAEHRWLANTHDERTLRLRLVGPGRSTTVTIDVDRLDGLSPVQLTSATSRVAFRLKRDAGTFTFQGVFVAGIGTGTYTFTPSADFLAALTRRKLEQPADADVQALALADVGAAYFDALAAEGYAGATPAQVVLALDHGVNLDYVREMGQAGYRLAGLDALVVQRDHGVSAQYVRELREQGLPELSPDDLVRARDHGVSPRYIRDLRELGYPQSSLEGLVRARDHGVSAEYIQSMRQSGYTLTLEELIVARDHGVSAEYVNGLRDLEFAGLALDTLVRARDHGISVDYIRDLREMGHRLALDDLVRARDHGVSADYIRGLSARGYEPVTFEALIRLRDHGVSTEYLEKLSALGLGHPSIDDLVAMRDRGFPEQAGQQLYRALTSNLRQIGWQFRCASSWFEHILSGARPNLVC